VSDEPDIAAVRKWLADGARPASTPEAILGELCERLVAAAIPLWRVAVFVRTLHPQVIGRRVEWRLGAGMAIGEASFDVYESEAFQGSPVERVYLNGQPLRLRLDEAGPNPPRVIAQLRSEGATDYLAVPLVFCNGEIHVATWTTQSPCGFSERDLAAVDAVIAPLARVTEIYALRRTAANLLDTYVGRDAGARILAGRIRRGFTETVSAAIWLSDMRGFTTLTDSMPAAAVIDLLNRYFDCQVPAILRHGGEVLKFMGDGLLAIFPLAADADPGGVCRAALAAANEMRSTVAALPDWPVLGHAASARYGLALHLGELLYGNIGAANRLDFTCIGPGVNLASRLADLAGELKRTTVLSADFARRCGAGIAPVGEFALAGFRDPQPVYGLADEA
jgi:adenylate cyclase